MAGKKRVCQDDDGRTIADMSGVEGPSLLASRSPGGKRAPAQPEDDRRSREDSGMTRKERRMYVLGAMKAAMRIGLAYILGLLIALLLWLWK